MNESKSQHETKQSKLIKGCYKYQNINERKQITTTKQMIIDKCLLLQISEYQ